MHWFVLHLEVWSTAEVFVSPTAARLSDILSWLLWGSSPGYCLYFCLSQLSVTILTFQVLEHNCKETHGWILTHTWLEGSRIRKMWKRWAARIEQLACNQAIFYTTALLRLFTWLCFHFHLIQECIWQKSMVHNLHVERFSKFLFVLKVSKYLLK